MTAFFDDIRIDVVDDFDFKLTPNRMLKIKAGPYIAERCQPDDNGRYAKLYHWTNNLKGELVAQVSLEIDCKGQVEIS